MPIPFRTTIRIVAVVAIALFSAPMLAFAQADGSRPVEPQHVALIIIGDSTVNNHTKGLLGWGDPIADAFDQSKIRVVNRARGGRSSRTYYTEGLWDKVLADLNAGDYVLMQFGHNDGGSLHRNPSRASLKGNGDETEDLVTPAGKEVVHTYGWYLREYIADAKAKGAIPIVLSPVPRNIWKGDHTIARASSDYGKWAAEAAHAGGAYFVDLNEIIAHHYEAAGREKVAALYFGPTDHTHTTPAGARLNAASVVEGLRGLADCPLKSYLLPQTLPTIDNVSARWQFRFKKFAIGAWWGPGGTDPEIKLYRDAGFNLVMVGRYMQLDHYGDPDSALREMDLAHKYGLGVMFDTYTKNNRPWGGKVGPTDSHPTHHPASLVELQWLYQKVGQHPALAGFLIGDDQGTVSPRSAACTQFLYDQPGPKLMPWLCGWIAPEDLARNNNPIEDPQIYPTLGPWDRPAETMAQQYCASYAGTSRKCQELGLLFWPMFNVSQDNHGDTTKPGYIPSDSLLRFPAYAALAYGAQGIWYFIYNGGALERLGTYHSAKEARAALTPLYPVASKVNHRVAAWGPMLLGRKSPGLFGTAFQPAVQWPFPGELAAAGSALALSPPANGKLIQSMSPDLIAGVLTSPGKQPLVMVVNCRVGKGFRDLPPRRVQIQFSPVVTGVGLLGTGQSVVSPGAQVDVTLEPGGGQLLELQGRDLQPLCTVEAIAAPPAAKISDTSQRPITDLDLAGIKQARVRIDIFGSNSRPPYNEKYIELNGHRIATVPANDSDSWSVTAVVLSPDQLQWVHRENQVVIRSEGGDAWKFRNLALAVQLANGDWVHTPIDSSVHSSPHWAYTEGVSWGQDGIAGPVSLGFR